MIPSLARFVEALRREGVAVSPAEAIDAARAVDAVGLERRDRFRAALSATLAKGARAREVFGVEFDRFFAPPSHGPGRGEREGAQGGGMGERRSRSEGSGKRPPHAPQEKPASRTGERRLERTAERRPERQPERKNDRRRLEDLRRGAGPSRLRKVLTRKEPLLEHRDLLHVDLSKPVSTEEERRLAREVPRLVQELRLRTGRRGRRARRGRIWSRRIFRENLSHGGIPFVLPFRTPRPRHVRVVVLVDVSHSVSRAAGYFLSMALEFLKPGRSTRVIAFVDRPVDATLAIERWGRVAPPEATSLRTRRRRPAEGIVRGGASFADWIESLRGLDPGAASDYGRMFHALLTSRHRPSGRNTVLVVLGDARTNRFDPLAWAFEEISRRVDAVLWLVPEPASRWGTADSALPAYLPSVDVAIEATDLSGLARGLGELLRRL
jgi:uncharacterized protein with von Willebrand factor type A (vWA) domain